MANTYLNRTASATATTFTYSAWIKRSGLASDFQYFFSYQSSGGGSNAYGLAFNDTTNKMYYYGTGGTATTDAVFRDPAAWYHVVLSVSSGTGTLYVNGETVKSSISVNQVTSGEGMSLGAYKYGSTVDYQFDGYMADVNFTDGTAYAPTTFGQTNTDGVWTPITNPSVTYGTNGFYLKFENSGAMGTDSSGNSNTFSVAAGTARQIIDTPTDGFCTLNAVRGVIGTNAGNSALSQGNLQAVQSGGYKQCEGTLYPTSGKWYWETLIAVGGGTDVGTVGIYTSGKAQGAYPGTTANGYGYDSYGSGSKIHNNTRDNSYGVSFAQGDIMGTALDLDNGTLTFYKNNSSQGQAYSGIDSSLGWGFGHGGYYGSTIVANFGQDSSFGAYKTAQNNADGNGVGDFYYTPPSGFLALCTENLKTQSTIDDGKNNFNTVLYTGTGSGASITGVGFRPDWLWLKARNSGQNNVLFDSVRGSDKQIISNDTGAETTNTTNKVSTFDSDGFTFVGDSGPINGNGNTFAAWNWKAGGTAPTNTYAVKVVSDSGNKYRFDDYGTSAITLELQEGGTFTFDQSDSSNAGHPLRFSTTADGTHGGGSEYTTGVTTTGTPGQAGAKTVITVAGSAPTLYYYCTQHSGMGGQANTDSLFGFTNVKGATQCVVSPNTTAGFSIITHAGTGGDTTIGHGLSSAPKMVIFKSRDGGLVSWAVYHNDLGTTGRLVLNSSASVTTSSSYWNSTAPSTTVISLGSSDEANKSGNTYVAYAFSDVEGYSRIGSYTGNGATNGSFVYTGFRPAWIMRKCSTAGEQWMIQDTTRTPYNPNETYLYPSLSNTEATSSQLGFDILSNGFKMRHGDGATNGDGRTYIYAAFADNPFVSSAGTPVTAR